VALSREQELLDAAVSYALAGAALVTPQLLSCPTPCPAWDLALLLDHLSDSIGVLYEALATGGVRVCAAPGPRGPGPDAVARLRGQTARLLAACATAGPAGRLVTIGDRALTRRMAAVTGAIEIAVHGWDIAVACGACRPVPPGLAAVLLPIAELSITPATRPGLFADPVRLPGPAGPGDQLIAFLGRQPRLSLVPEPDTRRGPASTCRQSWAGPRRFSSPHLVYMNEPQSARCGIQQEHSRTGAER
jgi:uncharacterized protein (TIGR03086 family)